MASRTVLTDDFDATITGDEVKTYSYSYQGKAYLIDLGADNGKALEETMTDYIAVSRPDNTSTSTSTRKRSTSAPRAAGEVSDAGKMREWAVANGFADVPKRGRVPADIREAYELAHPAA